MSPPPEPVGERCETGTASAALSPADRKIIGPAAPYPADGTLRGRDEELRTSQRARREVAWQVVERVVAEVPLAEPLPNAPVRPVIPAFQTWYDLEDERRVFDVLYSGLSKAERAARSPFTTEEIEAGFADDVDGVEDLESWPEERYLEYVADVDSASRVTGLGGISRVSYSPAAARHFIESYPQILACRTADPPPAEAEGPIQPVSSVLASVDVPACSTTEVGTYWVGYDETMRAVLDDGASGSIELAPANGEASHERCRADPGERCEIHGPGTFVLRASTEKDAMRASVRLTRVSPRPAWAACLDGPFDLDAVVIKADWRRAQFDFKVPVHSTSASALEDIMSGDASWEHPESEADPDAAHIHTVTTPNGNIYRMSGMHIMTKELDHWLWITLFWAPDPDEDFGADRPPSLQGSIWKNYKMCVTTAFAEGDPDPTGGFDADHPSLARALEAVYQGVGGPTWCSNPYIELGPGNAATNCVGCHQHAGTPLTSELIISDDTNYPAHGRTQLRNNFPTDYSWAINRGDKIGQLFQDEEDYWAAAP